MKHGLMYYLSSAGIRKNIGDYIQSIAADQFMHATELVEREHLNEYRGEKMKVILNGWFMHRPENFPPSDDIVPLFISFHLRPCMADAFLTDKTVAYLKAHGPIGCRDMNTVELLKSRGILAYFSNCLTLTLGRSFPPVPQEERHGVCFVDPMHCLRRRDAVRDLPWLFLHPVLAVRIFARMQRQAFRGESIVFRARKFMMMGNFLRTYLSLFTEELLLHADYYTHAVRERLFKSEEDKFSYCRNMLRRYATAKFCVTCRIHCALPCIAMGTPVVFVDAKSKDMGNGRFGGTAELFNIASPAGRRLVASFRYRSDSPGGRIDESTDIPVSDAFVKYARQLSEACMKFAED